MKKVVLAAGLVVAALLALVSVTTAAAPQQSTLHYFADPDQTPGDEVAGSSGQLVRTPNGVHAQLNTNDLDPGAYTVWWVVWNDPAECDGVCDGGDLGASGNFVGRATGGIVGADGLGNFGASLLVGDISEALIDNGGAGLTDPADAEVHMIVRYHGPIEAELLPGQIHTLDGGCASGDGSFDCFDPQAVAFLP